MARDAATAAGVDEWTLDGAFGPERWTCRGGVFSSVVLGAARTRSLTLADNDYEVEQLGLRRGLCAHPGPWPSAFRHCPHCGAALAPPAPRPPPEAWSPPSGAASGLPVLDPASDLAPIPASRREEVLPAAADLTFLVAGVIPNLFAYDRASGVLRVRREADRQWQRLADLPRADRLPRWSWSSCVLPAHPTTAFALATNAGPALVRLAVDAKPAVLHPDGAGEGLGGVACLRTRPAMPVRRASGLALACLAPNGAAWRTVPVAGASDLPGAGPATRFAAPVVRGEDAFWSCGAGLLSASLSGDEVVAEYRPWPAGRSPVLGVRPLQSESGTLYQLVRRGEDLPAFRSLTLPGTEAEERPYRLCLSAGNAVFADGKRRRLPWEETGSRAEYPLGDDEFVLPLLAFDSRRYLVALCAGRTTLASFVETFADTAGPPPPSRACRLAWAPATRTLVPLERRVDAASAWDIVPFVFRRRLYVYAAGSNACWSWALEPAA